MKNIRNFCIIAHIDHGKSTLADRLLEKTNTLNQREMQSQVLDDMDLEREKGITIKSHAIQMEYTARDGQQYTLNLIDTPGHVDFSYEVSRAIASCEGALLVVDATQGIQAQTISNLYLAVGHDLEIIPVLNKIDMDAAMIDEVKDQVIDLIGCKDEDILLASGKTGLGVEEVLEAIVHRIPGPEGDENAPLGMLVSSVDYSSFVGRIGVGKITAGTIKQNMQVTVCDYHNPDLKTSGKITALYQYDGLKKSPVDSATVGDIVAFSGIESITIGNTICDPAAIIPIPFVKISEPTIEMTFSVNDSPFAGKEGKFVTSRQIRDRLYRELLKDVSLHVKDTDSTDSFRVLGRGEMHLSILIETMRREGYEFQVGAPRVLYQEIGGKKCEPIEELTIDVPADSVGTVMEKMGPRKGELQEMHPQGDRMRLTFLIPARGLFGYRSEFLTDTKGEGIMSSVFHGYDTYKGDIPGRHSGSLIAFETGTAVAYGIFNVQDRGTMFINPGTEVYAGMVVGQNPKGEDISVNVCKTKHLTNTRASGSDDALRLVPPRILSLEEALEFLAEDELLEVTPKSIRIRKRQLDHNLRMREWAKKKAAAEAAAK